MTDVEVLPPATMDERYLFELLTSEGAQEWRHKVGVAGRADGSGKPSTRLLAARGWVLKTSMSAPAASSDGPRERSRAVRRRGELADVWHPSKVWALLRTEAGWLPVTACRELTTLRAIPSLPTRIEAWTRMLVFGARARSAAGVGLDLNPSNFGVEPAGGRLFYLDDELYPTLGTGVLAAAVAARIPEEPEVGAVVWRQWGRLLRNELPLSDLERASFVDDVAAYPLAEPFHGARDALLAGYAEAGGASRHAAAPRDRGDLVCVMADVHANLPALEAVLLAARSRGVRRFLFLGDAVGYGPHPRECVAMLAELDAILVGGNHDHAVATGHFELGMNRLARATAAWTRDRIGAAEIGWLAALPREQAGEGWLAVHGAPRDPQRFLAYVYDLTFEENLKELTARGVQVCFHGHTHVQVVHDTRGGGSVKPRELTFARRHAHLVNPGSVGQPRDGDPRAAFAIWNRSSGSVAFDRAAYDVGRTARDLAKADLPMELVARLEQGA